ncbi:hypothetical protein WOLCODRAFT_96170 [Wolfiporia cocos MD-104 SS10]|uniref:Uncharacterized protein n=1 Tax=Wolfiporia cocos (strain MD-104) TaxID=742152 RepID=A0A2H3J8J4_WOLCO|nr:hypothetical protein WOLCODRAFT_96170 [Wolfiporia cocos MD-104 SS10]
MYDYPLPAPASTTPPPSPHKGHAHQHVQKEGQRSHSPISHISTLLPGHTGAHAHHQYSPSTRAADISRLLDPAYASGSSSSGSSTNTSPTQRKHAQTRAYVDRNGDLHDPDYRDFPVLPPSARTSLNMARRRRSHALPRSRSVSRQIDRRYSSYSLTPRPEWERDWSTEVEDEDADALADDDNESQSQHSPFASHATTRRSATIHVAHAYHGYQPYVGEPQPILSSTPSGSLEDEQSPSLALQDSPLQESTFLTDESEELQQEKRKKAPRRSSGHSSMLRMSNKKPEAQLAVSPVQSSSYEKSEAERAPQQQFSITGDDTDEVPSCAASLRQHWAATVLRFRFGLFHAKRRLGVRRRSDAS